MPVRPAVDALPADVRAWLDAALVGGNFSGYEALEAALKDRGHAISKSAIHRHGSKLERKIAAIKTSTEAAKLIVASTDDAEDARSEALISLTQNSLFEALVSLNEADAGEEGPEGRLVLLGKASKGIADVVRASVTRKRFAADVRKAALAEAASAVEKVTKSASGLSADTAEAIKRAILGLA